MHLRERIEKAVMRRALNLPGAVARRVFGAPPVNDRGAELELQTHILLRLIEMTDQPDLCDLSVETARKVYTETTQSMDFQPADLHSVEDTTVPGPAGPIPLRVYRPGPEPRPAIIFYHGGGFVIGDLDGYDGICSRWAEWTDFVVISVDYRLAPEHPFPAAVEDATAAFRHIAQHAEDFGIDPARIAVAGDSAGANLAAVVCHVTNQDDRRPALQVLVFPTTDWEPGYPSMELFAEGYFLTARNMVWFADHYVQGQEAADARIAPILQEELTGLPDCYLITAGFDPLRDEGEAYADRLRDAGVRVMQHEARGLVHGFITMGGIIAEAGRINAGIASAIRRELNAIEAHEAWPPAEGNVDARLSHG